MKLVFLDESGKAENDVSVVAGIVVDAYRIRATRRDWIDVLTELKTLSGNPILEFHMRDAYSGRDDWSRCGIENRAKAIGRVLDFVAEKEHPIVFSSTLKTSFDRRTTGGCTMSTELGSRWICEAFHIVLSVNREHRKLSGNKGTSILIFDRGSGYEERLSDLIVAPPAWSDTYYDKPNKEEQLDVILDTSMFADSVHAPLIQLADTVAFILRRIGEIRDAGHAERFGGELKNLEEWLDKIADCFQSTAHRYKKTARCTCAELFWDIAPPSLRAI